MQDKYLPPLSYLLAPFELCFGGDLFDSASSHKSAEHKILCVGVGARSCGENDLLLAEGYGELIGYPEAAGV